MMKLFLDTADVSEVQKYFATGMIDGVTTNTRQITNSGRHAHNIFAELKLMGVKDISMETVGTAPEIVSEAHNLFDEFGLTATIRVPMSREGLLACRELSKDGIRVNVVLVFSAAQAILAAKSGAHYVTPHVSTCDDNSIAGLEVVRSISELYSRQGVRTEVMAASIKDVYKVTRAFYNGADAVTISPEIFQKMYDHALTREALIRYDKDWADFLHLEQPDEEI